LLPLVNKDLFYRLILNFLDIFYLFSSLTLLVVLAECPPTFFNYSSTATPMLFAVPITMLIAASMLLAFKSGIFISAISLTLSLEIVATFVLFGSPEPDSIPTAFFINAATGGVLVMKVNDLS